MDINVKLYELINKEFVDEFVKLVRQTCYPLRKAKYSTDYYLYHILLVLTDVQKWKSLSKLFGDDKKNHYKTIQDKHLQWSKLNLYEKAYKIVQLNHTLKNVNKNKKLNLYIDSTNIYNKNGKEQIGYGRNPKKQESNVSVICNENNVIYSITRYKIRI